MKSRVKRLKQLISIVMMSALVVSNMGSYTALAAPQLGGTSDVLEWPVPEGTGKVLYKDSFLNADKWTTYNGLDGSSWSVNEGKYSVTADRGGKTVLEEQSFADFVYEADLTVDSQQNIGDKSSAQAGILFRVTNPVDKNADGYDGYYYCIDARNGRVMIGKVTGGVWTEIAIKEVNIEFGKSYHVTVAAYGNHIVCYLDYDGKRYAKLDVIDNDHDEGSIGFRNWLSSSSFENVKVSAYTEPALPTETYQNPILPSSADPDVLYYNGTYYLYPTNTEDDRNGIKVYTSTDLVNWTDKGYALHRDDVWGDNTFWAPDIIERDGTFYMYYTSEEHLGVATSKSPLGPFTQDNQTPMHPDTKEIDAHVFKDDDGQYYLYFVRFDNGNLIYGAKLNDDMKSIDETSIKRLLVPDEAWESDIARVTEGPFMLKRDGIYYLTYSGSHFESPGYGSGYAVSSEPLGDYSKYENNPIMQSNSLAKGAGHHGIVESPDGTELFLVYHCHNSTTMTNPRRFCIDRLQFTEDQNGKTILEVKGPTVTPQSVPSGAVNVDNLISFDTPEHLTFQAETGSNPDSWPLPASVKNLVTSKSSPEIASTAKITWDKPVYDADESVATKAVVSGRVVLPEGIKNLGDINLALEAVVTLSPRPVEEKIITKLEAEDATLSGLAKIVNRDDASGKKKVGTIDNGEATVTFELNAKTAGTYRIDIASGSGSTEYNASQKYYINGDKAHSEMVTYQPGGWDNWNLYPIEVKLGAGMNTFTLTHSGKNNSFSELDYILFYTSNPAIEKIKLDGADLKDYKKTTLDYDVDVKSLEKLPKVTAELGTKVSDHFDLTVTQPTKANPVSEITLTGKTDKTFSLTYTLNFFDENAFSNPLVNYGADPYVTYQDGFYYYIRVNQKNALYISKAPELNRIAATQPVKVYQPSGTEPSEELWAPELHFLNGKWYIYYTAGAGANHRMYVLESKTTDALGEYRFVGKLAPKTDRWAIDQTVLELGGKLYAVWSGWQGSVNVDQRIYIAEMSNPYTIIGDRIELSKPEYPWELDGEPRINEGAQVAISPDGVVNVIYSASGSWTDNYCLGRLTLKKGGNPMDAADWEKGTETVFQKNGTSTFSTGHACFTTSPDGTENYMVYHATRGSAQGWNGRGVRTQKFSWNKDGTPNFGKATSYNGKVNRPSGTPVIERQRYEAEDGVLSGSALIQATYNSSKGKKVTGFIKEDSKTAIWIDVKKAGIYKLYVGASTRKANAGIEVTVNNGTADVCTVEPFNAADGNGICPDNWMGYELETELTAGVNIVTIGKNAKLEGADVDYLDVELIREVLPPVIDKSQLQSVYNQHSNKNQADYEANSWIVFSQALGEARKVLDNEAATQEQVETAKEALVSAAAKLMKKPPVIVPVMVTSLQMNTAKLSLTRGNSASLSVNVLPKNASNKNVTWTSSNPGAARVDTNGKVTALAGGTTVIKAISADGSRIEASCTVTVMYQVTYILNGGKNVKQNPTSYDGNQFKLKAPVRSLYTFKGWYKERSFKNKITSISKNDYTLYAKWEKVKVGKPSMKAPTAAKKAFTVTLSKKVSGTKGYQIAYTTDKKFKKGIKYASTSKTKTKISKLKSSKVYYVKMRAYKLDSKGSKVYGDYCKSAKIKVR